jgi:hypothetical protein
MYSSNLSLRTSFFKPDHCVPAIRFVSGVPHLSQGTR